MLRERALIPILAGSAFLTMASTSYAGGLPPPPPDARGVCVENCSGGSSTSSGGSGGGLFRWLLEGLFSTGESDPGPTPAQRRSRDLNQEGVAFAEKGDLEAALTKFIAAASANAANTTARNNARLMRAYIANDKGLTAWASMNWEDAASYFEEAARHDPGNKIIQTNLKTSRETVAERKKWKEAEERREKSLSSVRPQMDSILASLSADLRGSAGNVTDPQLALTPRPVPPASGADNSAGAQLMSATAHGRKAQEAALLDTASEQARSGFDSAGAPSGRLEAVTIGGSHASTDPLVPPEKRSAAVDVLEKRRDAVKRELADIDTRIRELEKSGRPVQANSQQAVELAQLKDRRTRGQSEVSTYNLKIRETLDLGVTFSESAPEQSGTSPARSGQLDFLPPSSAK